MQIKTFDLMLLNGANGFAIPGVAANGFLGNSVSSAGDINDDGIADLVLSGIVSYVVFGSRDSFFASFDLNTLNGSNGFTLSGSGSRSSSMAGDVNGDNIADLVIGIFYGASYVIFGSRNPFPASFNLANLNGSNGFAIPETAVGTGLRSVATAGDMNGDGISDLVLGGLLMQIQVMVPVT